MTPKPCPHTSTSTNEETGVGGEFYNVERCNDCTDIVNTTFIGPAL